MSKSLVKKMQEGFTIIEVMIVLAIAGLIMVVVLIAIPQLQRNQRNNARTDDASRIAAAVSNWMANNNGTVITAGASNANITAVLNDLGGQAQYTLVAIDPYAAGTANTLSVTASSATDVSLTGANALNQIRIITNAKCTAAGGLATQTGASTRQFAVLYAVETNAGTTPLCIAV